MIIVQMGDDYRTNGGSIIVQMGDGAKPQSSPICTIIIPHSPVDGHSLLPGRSLALVVSLLPKWGTGTKWLLPSTAIALSYRWGTGRSSSPVDGHSLLPGRSLALVVFIIAQMGDRCEAAAPVDGHSIIVQMGDGAKPLPRRWPLGMAQDKKKAPTPCGAGASLFC